MKLTRNINLHGVVLNIDEDAYELLKEYLSDIESRMYFERSLRQGGVYDRLEDLGIREGDTVSIYDLEFEYRK